MHLKILFLKMEYFTFSCTGLTNDFRFSNTHISPSKTHFAMPISLYLKRPLPSILSVFTFTVYSIDICSFTELKRVLSGKQYQNMYMSSENSRTTLMMKWNLFFFIPQHFFYVSRGCYNFEIFSFKLTCCGFHQKYRLSEYFSWIYYLNFTCC